MGIFGIAKKGFGMLARKSKVSPTIKSVKPAKNLKEKRETKEDFFKMIDKKGKNLSVGQRSILKIDAAKGIDKINKKYGKAKGGRI